MSQRKPSHKQPRLVEVDVDLDIAFVEGRKRAERLEHGVFYLAIAKHGGMTIAHSDKIDHELPSDIARVMQERPGVKA
jgi:hypothetical protein